jgi:hypothetical protein
MYAGRQWLMPKILATQKADIRKIVLQSHLWANSPETLSQKYPTQKWAGRVVQVRVLA